MANRATFLFSDGKFGWTESYYDSNNAGAVPATMANAQRLAQSRQQALAGPASKGQLGPQLQAIRVSNVETPRKTLLAGINSSPNQLQSIKVSNPSAPAADNPYSAVGVVFGLTSGRQSKRSFSGLDDSVILDQELGSSTLLSKLDSFLATLRTGGVWGALSFDRATANQRPITAVAQNPKGQPQLTLSAALAPPAGVCSIKVAVIDYKGNAGTPSINGVFQGFPDATNAIWTLGRVFKPLDPLCLGIMMLWEPVVDLFVSSLITGPTKKSRGRNFRLPRGRARRGA